MSENKYDFLSKMSENKYDFLSKMSENKYDFLDFLGNYAPWISFFGTILVFIFKNIEFVYLQIFIIGFFINLSLNIFLKQYIFNNNKRTGFIIKTTGKNTMPSGHAQATFFTVFFLSIMIFRKLIKGIEYNVLLTVISILGIITAYNCIRGRYHTIDQVEIGILFGFAVAYIATSFI